MTHSIRCDNFTVGVDPQNRRLSFTCRGNPVAETPRAPRFVLDGKEVEIEGVECDGGIRFKLRGADIRGSWTLGPAADRIEGRLDIEGCRLDAAVEICIPFPLESAVELPVNQKWSARVDSSEIGGKPIDVGLRSLINQLAAVEVGGAAIALTVLGDFTRHLPGTYGSTVLGGARRDDEAVWLHLRLLRGCSFQFSCHPDLEDLIDGYCGSLKRRFGILQLHEDEGVPPWLGEIKLFAAFEMWRSDGEILNSFRHVRAFCRDVESMGVEGGLAVNLLGFQGPFDSHYPHFDPHPRLGGREGLEAASRAIHAGGNRLRMHFNIWGLDPYLEDFEEMEHLALPYDRVYERIPTGQIGPYDGWPGPYPAVAANYETERVPLEPLEAGEGCVEFETPDLPVAMEAFLTIYGIGSEEPGTIRAGVGVRRVKAAFGGKRDGGRTAFRFRFRFARGRNRIRLEAVSGKPDFSRCTYTLTRAVVPGAVWSYPIIRADIHHPEWIEVARNNLVRVCREFEVDVPYIDAVGIWRIEDRPIFDAVREGLPGRVFGCEYPSELMYNMFRLCGTAFKRLPTNEEAGFVVSDFSSRITRRYARMFSAGRYYVPAGRMNCQMGALEAVDDERRAEAAQHAEECRRLGVIPGIRLNYRDHGFDQKAREVMMEAVEG